MKEKEPSENNIMEEKIEKGNEFESFVVKKFSRKYFSIVAWTTDINRKHNRYVESDSDPDLRIRYVPTDEEFSIECKFRSGLYQGKIAWCKYEQMERYRDYREKTGIPLFIVIGFGGEPGKPERMFCVPIEEIKYNQLYPSAIEAFERNPKEYFFWKNGVLE
ncbi:hypothetical protein PV02_01960 [Methanolobus chelungpuianus]|uniref:Uncharacterized protein n=2 Tax=Methanolobus chelungpuianus TaxID=502115 RepID=A0AAE3H9D3_9EURY|nr:hypothetical protein [Methanolobus chelungpuianus]